MTRFRHSRECSNPEKPIPPRRETSAFAGVMALETFYETININSLKTYTCAGRNNLVLDVEKPPKHRDSISVQIKAGLKWSLFL